MYMAMERLAPFVDRLFEERAVVTKEEVVNRAKASGLDPDIVSASEGLSQRTYTRDALLHEWTERAQGFVPFSFGERG